jgi:ribose transport system permease protein
MKRTGNSRAFLSKTSFGAIKRNIFAKQWGTAFILIFFLIIIAIMNPGFFTILNVRSIVNNAAIIGFITLGQTLVVLTKEFDLSVGKLLGLCTVVAAAATVYTKNLDPGLAAAIVILSPIIAGALFGFVTSLFVVRLGIVSFIATVSSMWIANGLAYFLLRGVPTPVNPILVKIGRGFFYNIPYSFIVLFVFLLIFHFIILKNSRFGMGIYAVGSNTYAATLSGVNAKLIKTAVFVISGFMCGIAAIFLSGWTTTGFPRIADGYELRTLAGVALGGVSFFGGFGNVFTPFLGISFLLVLDKFLIWRGISQFIANIAIGLILIISLLIQYRGVREE